jgi:hypothetical protein
MTSASATAARARKLYQRDGIKQRWFTTLMRRFQVYAAGNRRFFRLATARPLSCRTQALDHNVRITTVEERFPYTLADGGQIILHRDPFRKQKYSKERHGEIVAKYEGIIDPSTTERSPESIPYPYIRKTDAHRSLRDSLNSKGAVCQFPVLTAGVYPVLDLKQWGDTAAVIGVENDDHGCENDTVIDERRPVIWRELLSTYKVPSCAPLQWCPFTPIRKVPKGTLQKLKVTRSWHNETLTKDQQVTLLAKLQEKMLEAIKVTLKEEKSLKADLYWIEQRMLAKATEGIWEAIIRKGTQWVGGKRLVPFRYVNGVDGFENSVLGYTRAACAGWPDLIDAQRDEWNFKKELQKEGYELEEMNPDEVLYEMRRRIIEANPANATSGERERIVKQQGVRKSRAIKMKIKQTSKKWRGSYETSLNFDFPPFSPLPYPYIHAHNFGHTAHSSQSCVPSQPCGATSRLRCPWGCRGPELLMSPPSEEAKSNLWWYKWLSSQSPFCAKIRRSKSKALS